MGGLYYPSLHKILATNNVPYQPFVGKVSGSPSTLEGRGTEIIAEAKRLIDTIESEGFLVFLGLGGGYLAEAALERDETCMALVIEYDLSGLAELLSCRDYTRLFGDPRFRFFIDIQEEELIRQILNLYQPALFGGIRVIPLRSRTTFDTEKFNRAGSAVETAVEKVSADYSVQAHFGQRWFSNIIRNLKSAAGIHETLPTVQRAAITAAGPSLSFQIKRLKEKRAESFLIATDTSLPCLLNAKIIPDAVISMDCQHISYYHFMEALPDCVLLFLDLASPPLLSSRSKKPLFFSGGHPLTKYICRTWKALPELDNSGGNVTYAALSLAEQLGASEIELYGADFSYPLGVSYARGTYIYSYFGKRQSRLSPLEAQASVFLFRTPLEKINRPACPDEPSWYYETKTLKFYREKLEEKSSLMEAAIIPIAGQGAPIHTRQREIRQKIESHISFGKELTSVNEFLTQYRNRIAALPSTVYSAEPRSGSPPEKNVTDYLASLETEAQTVFTTVLPAVAALKRRYPHDKFSELMERTRTFCLQGLDTVLAQ
jgi:hypothetical protein